MNKYSKEGLKQKQLSEQKRIQQITSIIPLDKDPKELPPFPNLTYFSPDGQYYARLHQIPYKEDIIIYCFPSLQRVLQIDLKQNQAYQKCLFTQDNKYFVGQQNEMDNKMIYLHDLVENMGMEIVLKQCKGEILKIWTSQNKKLSFLLNNYPILQLFEIDQTFTINLIKQIHFQPIAENLIIHQQISTILNFRIIYKHSLKLVTSQRFYCPPNLFVPLSKFIFINDYRSTFIKQIGNCKNIRIMKEKYSCSHFVVLRNWLIIARQKSLIFYDYIKGSFICQLPIQMECQIIEMCILRNYFVLKVLKGFKDYSCLCWPIN